MAGIGLKQLTVSLVTKGILPEGTTEEELLDKLKSAEVLEKHDDVNSRVDTSKLQKLLIYLRGGEIQDIKRNTCTKQRKQLITTKERQVDNKQTYSIS